MTFVIGSMSMYSILLLFYTTDAGPGQLLDSAISLQAIKGDCDDFSTRELLEVSFSNNLPFYRK